MTWTATEREGMGSYEGYLVTYIHDSEGLNFICELHVPADDHAAIEQMRARAKLIVQAEAMLDALSPFACLLDRHWHEKEQSIITVEGGGEISELQAIRLNDVLKARAIIKATGGEDG